MSLLSTPFDPAREAALVTGAGNGIGRAIAQALVGEGVRTVFADVNRDTVTAAIKASARPELAVSWVGESSASDDRSVGHTGLCVFFPEAVAREQGGEPDRRVQPAPSGCGNRA